MKDILDHFEDRDDFQVSPRINEKNALIKIFTEPRLAFRYVLAEKPKRMLFLILLGIGFSAIFVRDDDTLVHFFLKELSYDWWVVMPINFITYLGVTAALIFLQYAIGAAFDGKANLQEVTHVYAWAMVPGLINIPFQIFEFFFSGSKELTDLSLETGADSVSLGVFGVINYILSIWSTVLNVIGLSIAHGISGGKSCFVIFIGFILIMIPIGYLLYDVII